MKSSPSKIAALIFGLALPACAQTTLTLTGPATIQPGTTATLTLTLAGSSGQNVSGLMWSLTPPASSTVSAPTNGAAATAAQKTPYCTSTNATCVSIGLSTATPPVPTNQSYADGVVATIPVAIPRTTTAGSVSIPLTNLSAASTQGFNVAISSGAAYSLNVLSLCDVNGDGVVNYLDVQAILSVLLGLNGQTSCPASLSADGCTLETLIAVDVAATGGACTLK